MRFFTVAPNWQVLIAVIVPTVFVALILAWLARKGASAMAWAFRPA